MTDTAGTRWRIVSRTSVGAACILAATTVDELLIYALYVSNPSAAYPPGDFFRTFGFVILAGTVPLIVALAVAAATLARSRTLLAVFAGFGFLPLVAGLVLAALGAQELAPAMEQHGMFAPRVAFEIYKFLIAVALAADAAVFVVSVFRIGGGASLRPRRDRPAGPVSPPRPAP